MGNTKGEFSMTKVKRNRSPNYPVVNLKSAIAYTEKLHAYANGQHFVPLHAAFEDAWGMKKGSAYGKQVVAAIKAFGLVDETGSGDARQIRISDTGDKIRGGHSDRDRLLRQAAIAPKLHAELWSEFGGNGNLPPDASMRQYLVFDRDGNRFNESSVGDFIAEFRETVDFAALFKSQGGHLVEESKDEVVPEDSSPDAIKVGTVVQWTSQGACQFDAPLPITRIVEKDGERFAYFEVKDGWAPMSELTIAKEVENVPDINLLKPEDNRLDHEIHESPAVGMVLDRETLDEGAVRLEWPAELSEASVEEFQDWIIGRINRARRKANMSKITVSEQ